MNKSTTPFSKQALVAAGYREFRSGTEAGKSDSWYDTSFQLRVDDHLGKKYFINVHIFRVPAHTLAGNPQIASMTRDGLMFQAEVQFTIDADGDRLDVSYSATKRTIGQMEAVFETVWGNYGFHYELT